jgi:arylsulfatase A-like enzyme
MKVPIIITGPGVSKGVASDALVYLFDLFPTLAEICNVPVPPDIDGKSLMPVISGKSEGVRNSLFTAYRNTVRAVRNDTFKLIRYPERDYNQLFNLITDPLELNNLANSKDYRKKLDEMTELMKKWQTELNDKAPLEIENPLPLNYDYTKLKRVPDGWQPEYTLKKYFEESD